MLKDGRGAASHPRPRDREKGTSVTHCPVAVQLYSVRNALETDPVGTIDRIAEIGYQAVEAGFKYLTTYPELVDAIHRHGFETPTLTSPLFEVADREPVWALAERLGSHTVIETFIPEEHWTSVADVDHIAAELNDAAAQAAAHGLRVGYHNHWWELETIFEGRRAMELLIERLNPEIVLEPDVYWVTVGGEDPVEFVRRHAERVRFLHLKDGPVNHDNTQQQPAGQGAIPIRALLETAVNLEGGVVEFDEYCGDIFDAIAQAHAYLTDLVAQVKA